MAKGPVQFKAPKATPSQTYSFGKGFAGGMNTHAMADQIAENESPDIMNMELRDGAWSKRYGFNRVNETSWGIHPVRGTYEFWKEGAASPIILVAWNGKMHSMNTSTGALTNLCTGAKTSIADATVTFFTMNDKAYFLTGTEYCYYDGTNPVAVVAGYVPTIDQGVAPDGTGGTSYQELNFLIDSYKRSFNGTAGTTEYKLPIEADTADIAWVNGVETTTGFSLGVDNLTVTFDVAPGEGTNNVIIQATYDGLNDPTNITHCTIAHEWGGSSDTRAFLSGNPEISNRRWYTQVLEGGIVDATYFPVNNWDDVGSNAEAVTGLGRLVDYEILYKKRSTHYSYAVGPDDTTGLMSYPILPMNDEYGCIAPRTVCPAQNGLLALSEQGVTYTAASFVRGQLNVAVISEKVNRNNMTVTGGINSFTMAEREAAFAYVYDQKYWLHIQDRVWILDLRYSSLTEGYYCWYPYTGTPGRASCFMESGEVLYAGDDTVGLVYEILNAESAHPYRDDDTAYIDAWWTSPMLYGGARDWIKRFRQLSITYGGQAIANHVLTYTTEDGEDATDLTVIGREFDFDNIDFDNWTFGSIIAAGSTVVSYVDSRPFNFDYIDFDNWTFGSAAYPATIAEKPGYKSEYLQWKIRNCIIDEGLVILGQSLVFELKRRVR